MSIRINPASRQRVRIILCDPVNRNVQGQLKDGGIIQISIWDTPPAFKWPKAEEFWVVRREGVNWFLENQFDIGPEVTSVIEDLQPGETKITGDVVHIPGDLQITGSVTPGTPDTGWTTSNVTSDKVFDANNLTLHELADVVGTLIATLKTKNILDD